MASAVQEILVKFTVKSDGTATVTNMGKDIEKLGDAAEKAKPKTESMFSAFLKADMVRDAMMKASQFMSGAISKAIELSDALAETEAGFRTMADRAGVDATDALNSMRTASDGLMTDIELMRSASTMMGTGLKLNADQMGQLTAAAKALGEAHGIDLKQAMDAVTMAIARGNDKGLLALGIDIDLAAVTKKLGDEATEAQKKQAVLNEVLIKSKEAAEGVSASGDTLSDKLQRLRTDWDNWLASVGTWIDKSPIAQGAIVALQLGLSNMNALLPIGMKLWENYGTALIGVIQSVGLLTAAIAGLVAAAVLVKKTFDEMRAADLAATTDMVRAADAQKKTFDDLKVLFASLTEEQKKHVGSVHELIEKYGSAGGLMHAIAAGQIPEFKEGLQKLREEHDKARKASDDLGKQLDDTTKKTDTAKKSAIEYAKELSILKTEGIYELADFIKNFHPDQPWEDTEPIEQFNSAIGKFDDKVKFTADELVMMATESEEAHQQAALYTLKYWQQTFDGMLYMIAQIGQAIGGAAGDWVSSIAGFASNLYNAIKSGVMSAKELIVGGLGDAFSMVGNLVGGFTQKAINFGSKIGSTIGGAIAGPLGEAIGGALGAIGGGIVSIFKAIFGQRSPEQAALEEVGSQMGLSISKGLADALSKKIGEIIGKTGEDLEDAMVWAIYIPEAQMMLFEDQMAHVKELTTDAAEFWAKTWTDSTRAVLINELGKTEEEAAKAMGGLIQTALDKLKQGAGVMGDSLANLVAWATRLGVEFDLVGLKVKDAAGNLIDAEKWIIMSAGPEIFAQKWKTAIGEVDTAIKEWLNAGNFEKRVAGVSDVLTNFFKKQIQQLDDMISKGLSKEQLAQISAEILPQMQAIADYQLQTLEQMQKAGMSTTEIWNSVGESMGKQLALMRRLGQEGTEAYKKLNEEYTKLRNQAQTIAGIEPMINYFKELNEQGRLTADNFDKYAGMALTYAKRLIEAGATSAEVWNYISGVFETLKAKHDEVYKSVEDKMKSVLDKTENLSAAAKAAIEAYVNTGKGSLEQLAAMGVPAALLDQIAKWRELKDEVSGPVYDALEKFYKQQEKLEKTNDMMNQIDALFAAMGKNLIKNDKDLELWSNDIHKYFNEMIKGGMSLKDIVAQHGDSLHQLYLEYQKQGKDVPKWLANSEKEYQKQEKARKAADQAQRDSQVALLEGLKAIIKALGGDVPASMNKAINAINKLGADDGGAGSAKKLNDQLSQTADKKMNPTLNIEGADKADKLLGKMDEMHKKSIKPKVDFDVAKAKNLGEFSVTQDRVDLKWQPAAKGMPYVPYDEYPALLHRGEAVIPAYANPYTPEGSIKTAQAGVPMVTSGGGAASAGSNVSITINTLDTKSMEEAVRKNVIPVLNRAITRNDGGIASAMAEKLGV